MGAHCALAEDWLQPRAPCRPEPPPPPRAQTLRHRARTQGRASTNQIRDAIAQSRMTSANTPEISARMEFLHTLPRPQEARVRYHFRTRWRQAARYSDPL